MKKTNESKLLVDIDMIFVNRYETEEDRYIAAIISEEKIPFKIVKSKFAKGLYDIINCEFDDFYLATEVPLELVKFFQMMYKIRIVGI